eukprot:CAMPEP_0194545788 /NCGR_PEP_ID=MMETSP0253-20130528/89704_1 /TAXON_ID=2966 /ORGANISM="Noctiluca scintillans" /LENGTH=66 /DNA_ID=CAMNT_0039392819 /DNA_START=33 /DNA_END=229 /DNA_ORIENTATION=-
MTAIPMSNPAAILVPPPAPRLRFASVAFALPSVTILRKRRTRRAWLWNDTMLSRSVGAACLMMKST